jgi:hypothetical protein
VHEHPPTGKHPKLVGEWLIDEVWELTPNHGHKGDSVRWQLSVANTDVHDDRKEGDE